MRIFCAVPVLAAALSQTRPSPSTRNLRPLNRGRRRQATRTSPSRCTEARDNGTLEHRRTLCTNLLGMSGDLNLFDVFLFYAAHLNASARPVPPRGHNQRADSHSDSEAAHGEVARPRLLLLRLHVLLRYLQRAAAHLPPVRPEIQRRELLAQLYLCRGSGDVLPHHLHLRELQRRAAGGLGSAVRVQCSYMPSFTILAGSGPEPRGRTPSAKMVSAEAA